MPTIRETLEQLPPGVRHALLRELQALNGYQGSDLALPDDEVILAALEQTVSGKPPRPRRVVITGIGAVTPVGNTAPETWASFVAGRSGVTRVTQFDPSAYASQVGAELKGFDLLRTLSDMNGDANAVGLGSGSNLLQQFFG